MYREKHLSLYIQKHLSLSVAVCDICGATCISEISELNIITTIVPVDNQLEAEGAAKGQCKHYHPGLFQGCNLRILTFANNFPPPLHLTQYSSLP